MPRLLNLYTKTIELVALSQMKNTVMLAYQQDNKEKFRLEKES